MNESESTAMELVFVKAGKKHKITAKAGTEVVFVNTIDPASESQRSKYAKAIHGKCPAIETDVIEAELMKFAASISSEVPKAGPTATASPVELPADVIADAESLLEDPELIRRICDDVASLGVAGERELALTVYLVGTSRLLPKPLAGIVRGSSSSGKSFLIERVASLFPSESVIFATQMTPQALFHMPKDSLRHKWVVAGERSRGEDDDRAEATRALREMLSGGRLSKMMPMKVEGGRIETVLIEQEGPIAFIESTTLTDIFEEDANRCLLLQTDEREEQTRRIVQELAKRHAIPKANSSERTRLVHYAVQRSLPTVEVRVPYADRIAGHFDCKRVEVRRAFPQLLSVIQGSALLHHRQRSKDANGAVLANATDYQIARRLIAKSLAVSLGGGVSESALRFFEKLKECLNGEFTSRDAELKRTFGRSSVYGWLSELHKTGAVEVVEIGRGRSPTRWKLTGTEPTQGEMISPRVEDIFPEVASRRKHEHNPKTAEFSLG